MSVILDALRRSRKAEPASGPALRGEGADSASTQPRVPAGLGLSASSPHSESDGASRLGRSKRGRAARPTWLLLSAVLVVGLGVWAGIQVVRLVLSAYAPTQSAQSAAPVVPHASRTAPTPAAPVTTSTPSPVAASVAAANAAAQGTPDTETAAPATTSNAPRASEPSRTTAPRRSGVITPGTASRVPPESEINHFALAVRYQSLGNYEEALKHYLAVIAADAFNVEARNNLGLLYHSRGLTSEAVDQFRVAIAVNPQYARARSNLAVVLTSAGRLAEARAELRAAMAIEPRNVDLLVNLALVEKAERHRDAALELLVKAIGIQPTHGIAHYNAAVLYEEQHSIAMAYEHYADFLKYAGPEHGALLYEVQRRLLALKPRLAQN
jgi:Tfp pilus assembly protein PilF